ncbi:Importin-4 [Mizuhopecten yessoensis]|uniref:Importin-4 n=1 Tax=Mizuhopecten yessoensis TaxID=6573 RepID=A0A210PE81_MIZYE|nr:Importin-4 [Mizuhopecten yessoensis]
MASNLEETLGKLLVPDNNTIQLATQQLKELFKDPNIVPGLCQVLGSSQVPQVRQFAAVLLRRKIQKGRQYRALPENIIANIRDNILQILVQEPEKSVRNSISQVIAVVAKHDLPTNSWPQLLQFLGVSCKSQTLLERETGVFVLHSVAAGAGEQLKPHLASLLQMLSVVVNDAESLLVPYYSIRTITELIFFIGEDEKVRYILQSVPYMSILMLDLLCLQEKACEMLEVFDEMLECEVNIIVPYMKTVVDFCLEVAGTATLGDSVRVKAMSFIASFVKLKKKAFLKQKLVNPVLNVIFPVMCAGSEDDEEDEDEIIDEVEAQKPSVYGPQVIDTMALHLPPDKFIPNLMAIVEPAILSETASHRRAAYLALAVVVEGCADYITNKHLQAVLQCVVKGLNDPDQQVRNSALFALGQFSEHLQPDISKFASELLPLLFQYLGRATQEADKNPKGLTKSYYALEMFCENLGKDILPYLSTLMEHLINVLKTSPTNRPKELAISALGATVNAAKEGMKPYFPVIIEQFKGYLMAGEDEEMRKLQIQTLDTLGVLARGVGLETFLPLTKECAQLGLNLLHNVDDPDLRRCVYGLFASLSSIMKGDIGPYLENLITHMIGSLKSTEGVKAHVKVAEEQVSIFNEEDFGEEEDISQEDDEEDDEQHIEGISVENAFVDEKEDTCCALGELAANSGAVFFPYLEKSFKEVTDMMDYPAQGVKRSASAALGQMCICVHKANTDSPTLDTQTALTAMLNTVVVKYLELIKTDVDREIVMTVIDTLSEMLDKIGQPVLQVQGARDAILSRMKEVFTHKLACQDQDEDEDDEDEEAEFDGMLIESAGDVLPLMAKLIGGPEFLPFFSSFLQDLVKRLKETSAVSEKSFAVGTLAEIVQACGTSIVPFTDTLYPLFMKMVKDEDDEVRSNSVFAVGVLLATSGETLFSRYPEVLKCLFDAMSKAENPRLLDNICAATCRMIMANKAGVPMSQVVPVVMQCLPLKEDFEENETVYKCLYELYSSCNEEILKQTPKLLEVVSQVLGSEGLKDETQSMLIQMVKMIQKQFPEDFKAITKSLPPEQGSKLETCLTYTNGAAS